MSIASLAEAKDALNIDQANTDHDDEIQLYVDAADRVIEDLVGPVTPADFDEWYDGGYGDIVLRHWPVTDITAVTEYSGATPTDLTVATSPDLVTSTSYVLDPDTAILYRRSTWGNVAFATGTANIRVQYTAGRATTPANIKLAAIEFIRHNYQLAQQGGSPTYGGAGEEGPWVPSGFAIPARVYELLQPDLRERPVV